MYRIWLKLDNYKIQIVCKNFYYNEVVHMYELEELKIPRKDQYKTCKSQVVYTENDLVNGYLYPIYNAKPILNIYNSFTNMKNLFVPQEQLVRAEEIVLNNIQVI